MTKIIPKEWATVSRAASLVGVSRQTLLSAVERGPKAVGGIETRELAGGTVVVRMATVVEWARLRAEGAIRAGRPAEA